MDKNEVCEMTIKEITEQVSKLLGVVSEENDERHICPLQVDVIERCIQLWTNDNDLVFDPFAGIGSTGYIAIKTGRRFLGIELKESYFNQAVGNLREAEKNKNQKTLFDCIEKEIELESDQVKNIHEESLREVI